MAAGRWEWDFRGWLLWEVRCPPCHSLGTAGRDQTQQVWEIFGIQQLGRRRIKAGLGVLPKAVYFCMGIMEGTTQGWWKRARARSRALWCVRGTVLTQRPSVPGLRSVVRLGLGR